MFVFGRIQMVRSFVLITSKQPLVEVAEKNTEFEEINVDNVVEVLKKEALYLGINLPKAIVQELLEFSKEAIYLGNGNLKFPFSLAEKEKQEIKYDKRFITGYHRNSSAMCPVIKKLENDYKLWEIAAKYLERIPVLIGSQLWWTFANKEIVDERMQGMFRFHYDLEDYRFVKFMFYLTDVDLSSSPHIYVKGSHKKKKLRHQFSILRDRDDQDIIDYYGIENVINICGSAGLGFAEDPFCFHKGTVPVSKDRLILEVKFASNNYEFAPNTYKG